MPMALRAPEIILQSSFDHRIDIWSFGCYLFEIIAGHPLFNLPPVFRSPKDANDDALPMSGADNGLQMNDDDHLLQMYSALGPLPLTMFERWPRRMRYFDANMKLIRTDVGKSEVPLCPCYIGPTLEQNLRDSRKKLLRGTAAEERVDAKLLHVMRSALRYDPNSRLSASNLLSLDWFTAGEGWADDCQHTRI